MRRFNPEKELEKIQHRDRNKVIIGVVALLIIIGISSSYALYQVRYSKRIIYTKVAPFSNKDIELAIYLDNVPSSSNEFPEKNSGYRYDKIMCDNGSTAKFDNTKWKVILETGTKDSCDIYFVKENEGIPNAPELYQGLIPITYENDGTILVADGTKDWYNYDDKKWANAVLVSNENYNKYVNDGEYIINKTIPISEVLQMYVWIPRYKYQLFNVDYGSINPQEIKIEFENGTLSTGDAHCTINDKGVESCINAENGNWYTHPAFTFGETELPGIWVGKFETSGNNTNVKIIPNVNPMLNVNISYMFNAARNIDETYANNFNLNSEKIDTHMMKNMEWGAMAYLTHSKYGKCDGQGKCTEVAMNNTTNYITGYNETAYTWNTTNGQLASTTGNLYGIYDTNGGAWEWVMGNMVDASGTFYSGSAGFNTTPDSKYYDVYEYDQSNSLTHKRGHLGDATRETLKTFENGNGGWYDDYSGLPYGTNPWFSRSSCFWHGNHAGTFTFSAGSGEQGEGTSFRVALTVQDGNT